MIEFSEHFEQWGEFTRAIAQRITAFESRWKSPSAVPFFRGHSSTAYALCPSLFRPIDHRWYTAADERNLFYEFRSRGGVLLPREMDSWEQLFTMRHYDLPTRLLDWSESFAAALFFALSSGTSDSDVDLWFLDPYEFNKATVGVDEILDVRADLKHDYFDYFIEAKANPEWTHAVAIYPERRSSRLVGQAATFTLHLDCTPLEQLSLPGLSRYTLGCCARDDAERYLQLTGVNDQTLFGDLDGLVRFLRRRFPPQNDCTWTGTEQDCLGPETRG